MGSLWWMEIWGWGTAVPEEDRTISMVLHHIVYAYPLSTPFPLIGGKEISAQQMVQWFLVNHAHNHLGAIHKTIGGSLS